MRVGLFLVLSLPLAYCTPPCLLLENCPMLQINNKNEKMSLNQVQLWGTGWWNMEHSNYNQTSLDCQVG